MEDIEDIEVRRLGPGDESAARETFAMMADVFGDAGRGLLGTEYLRRLLARDNFWAFAAYKGQLAVGGLTAHTLPMTRAESAELMIYDLAVHASHQRQGVGARLVSALCAAAAAAGIAEVFVPADNADTGALDFYQALGGEPAAVTHYTFRPSPSVRATAPRRD